MVYLDHNATTPLCEEARKAMLPFWGDLFGNPSSIHSAGRAARAALDDARSRLARELGGSPREIIFTGGGTESCNLGVIGLARAHASKGKHIITSSIEHHAVLQAFEYLRDSENFEVGVLPVGRSGAVCPGDLDAMIRPDTCLASIMHANNETGIIQPIQELTDVCRKRGVLFHSDAIQTFGKIPVRPRELGVSALSLAAHKFRGPKGVGALYLAAGTAISRTAHGGSHENSRRPGTENVPGIVGMAAAAEASATAMPDLAPLRDELWRGIREIFPGAIRNGDPALALANTLNVSFPGVDGETFLIGLDLNGVCASGGSACMVGAIQQSHVLLAMGGPRDVAPSAVRFSLGRETTPDDIRNALGGIRKTVEMQPRSRTGRP